jgi:PH (Pleckstrin Homology) domain-containing protein
VLTVGVLTVLGIVWAVQRHDPRLIFLGLPFTLMVFVLGRYAPTGYRLGADGVRIDRRAGPVVIPYRRIRGADREPRPLAGLSVFASQGVFGRFGRFWNMRLGFYRLFLTNRDTVVWLATDDGWLGLSPDRPDEFVERVRGRLTPTG